MHLPKGFKLNGNTTNPGGLVRPRAKKIIQILEALPFGELLTSTELGIRSALSFGGSWAALPVLSEYREKVDGNKLYWGSRKTIARLRQQLTEASDAKN
jgi:hypothetical protein